MEERDETDLQIISIIERAGSVLSLMGCLFVIVTFCCCSGFHKPVNRLVFYATFGNMMTNIGTLMSRSYVDEPDSAGCQLQSFLIQMFMPADAFWTFAMAVNIYLTFYHRFDAGRLAKMEMPYLVCCFGVPFVPALVFVFIKDNAGQRVYGDARLWCWVSREWHILRLAAFYGPVWLLILATILIYVRAGHTIYRKRSELQQVSEPPAVTSAMTMTDDDVEVVNKRSEITVTTQISTNDAELVTTHLQSLGLHGIYNPHEDGYSVSISSGRLTARGQHHHMSVAELKRAELNQAAWSYTKCAILFFTALLVTWIPSSANRVYAFTHGNESLLALEFISALVLPLQGFWNAVIYAVTSWSACRGAWDRFVSGVGRLTDRILLRRGGRSGAETRHRSGGSHAGGDRHHHQKGFRLGSTPPTPRRGDGALTGSESMTELALPEIPHEPPRGS